MSVSSHQSFKDQVSFNASECINIEGSISENDEKTAVIHKHELKNSLPATRSQRFLTLEKAGVIDHHGLLQDPWVSKDLVPLLPEEAQSLRKLLMDDQVLLINNQLYAFSFGKLHQDYKNYKIFQSTIPYLSNNKSPTYKGVSYLAGSYVLYALFMLFPDYIDRLFADLIEKQIIPKGFFKKNIVKPKDFDVRTKVFDLKETEGLSSADLIDERNLILNLAAQQLNIDLKNLENHGLQTLYTHNTGFNRFQIVTMNNGFFEWILWNVLSTESLFNFDDLYIEIDDLLEGSLENIIPKSHSKCHRQGILDVALGLIRTNKVKAASFNEKAMFHLTKYYVQFEAFSAHEGQIEVVAKRLYERSMLNQKFQASLFFSHIETYFLRRNKQKFDAWIFLLSLINLQSEILTIDERIDLGKGLSQFLNKKFAFEEDVPKESLWIINLQELIVEYGFSYSQIYGFLQFASFFLNSEKTKGQWKYLSHEDSKPFVFFTDTYKDVQFHVPIFPAIHSLSLCVFEGLTEKARAMFLSWFESIGFGLNFQKPQLSSPLHLQDIVDRLFKTDEPLSIWMALHLICIYSDTLLPASRSSFLIHLPSLIELNISEKEEYFKFAERVMEVSQGSLSFFKGSLVDFYQCLISLLMDRIANEERWLNEVVNQLISKYLALEVDSSYIHGLILKNVSRVAFLESTLNSIFYSSSYAFSASTFKMLFSLAKGLQKRDLKMYGSLFKTLCLLITNKMEHLSKVTLDKTEKKEFSQFLVWLIKRLQEGGLEALIEGMITKASGYHIFEPASVEKKMAFIELFLFKIKDPKTITLWFEDWIALCEEGFLLKKTTENWFKLHIEIGKALESHGAHQLPFFYKKIETVEFPACFEDDLTRFRKASINKDIQNNLYFSIDSFKNFPREEREIYTYHFLMRLLEQSDFQKVQKSLRQLFAEPFFFNDIILVVDALFLKIIENNNTARNLENLKQFCFFLLRSSHFTLQYKWKCFFTIFKTEWKKIENLNELISMDLFEEFSKQFRSLIEQKICTEDYEEAARLLVLNLLRINTPSSDCFVTSLEDLKTTYETCLQILYLKNTELACSLQTFLYIQGLPVQITLEFQEIWLKIWLKQPHQDLKLEHNLWIYIAKTTLPCSLDSLSNKVKTSLVDLSIKKGNTVIFLELFLQIEVCNEDLLSINEIEGFIPKLSEKERLLTFEQLIYLQKDQEEKWVYLWLKNLNQPLSLSILDSFKSSRMIKSNFAKKELGALIRASAIADVRNKGIDLDSLFNTVSFFSDFYLEEYSFWENFLKEVAKISSAKAWIFFNQLILKKAIFKHSKEKLRSCWLIVLKQFEEEPHLSLLSLLKDPHLLKEHFENEETVVKNEVFCTFLQATAKIIALQKKDKDKESYIHLLFEFRKNIDETDALSMETVATSEEVIKKITLSNSSLLPRSRKMNILITRMDCWIVMACLKSENSELIRAGLNHIEHLFTFVIFVEISKEFSGLIQILASLCKDSQLIKELKSDVQGAFFQTVSLGKVIHASFDVYTVLEVFLEIPTYDSRLLTISLYKENIDNKSFQKDRRFWSITMEIVDKALIEQNSNDILFIQWLSGHPIFTPSFSLQYNEFTYRVLSGRLAKNMALSEASKKIVIEEFYETIVILQKKEEWLTSCVNLSIDVLVSYSLKNPHFEDFKELFYSFFTKFRECKNYSLYCVLLLNKCFLEIPKRESSEQERWLFQIKFIFEDVLFLNKSFKKEILRNFLLEFFITSFQCKTAAGFLLLNQLIQVAILQKVLNINESQKNILSPWLIEERIRHTKTASEDILKEKNAAYLEFVVPLLLSSAEPYLSTKFRDIWQISKCVNVFHVESFLLNANFSFYYKLLTQLTKLAERAESSYEAFAYLDKNVLLTPYEVIGQSRENLNCRAKEALKNFAEKNYSEKKIRLSLFCLTVQCLKNICAKNVNFTEVKPLADVCFCMIWKNILCGYFVLTEEFVLSLKDLLDIFRSIPLKEDEILSIQTFPYLDINFLYSILKEFYKDSSDQLLIDKAFI